MLLALGALGQIGRSDRFMERKIREIYCPDRVTAFPVGFFHAMDCYSRFTLYSKLADLNPKRLFLHQA